jgi:hypothetical protein
MGNEKIISFTVLVREASRLAQVEAHTITGDS